jgi:hypothetical protein
VPLTMLIVVAPAVMLQHLSSGPAAGSP